MISLCWSNQAEWRGQIYKETNPLLSYHLIQIEKWIRDQNF